MGATERKVKCNVVDFTEYARAKMVKNVSSTKPTHNSFTFEMSKLSEFILSFIRDNETKLTDEEILSSLRCTFYDFNKEYDHFNIDLIR